MTDIVGFCKYWVVTRDDCDPEFACAVESATSSNFPVQTGYNHTGMVTAMIAFPEFLWEIFGAVESLRIQAFVEIKYQHEFAGVFPCRVMVQGKLWKDPFPPGIFSVRETERQK